MATMKEFAASMGLTLHVLNVGKNEIDGKTPFKYLTTLQWTGKSYSCEFTKGAAHVGKISTLDRKVKQVSFSEMKKAIQVYGYGERLSTYLHPIKPDILEVLECLQCDCNCIDGSPLWEDFASNCGMNPDSRKDHVIYEKCKDAYITLRDLMGQQFFREFLKAECE